jgi:uncharacterized membrane-anchored protein
MLKSIRAGNDAGNKERREKGWPELTITRLARQSQLISFL